MEATQVGNALRSARKKQRMSQRAYAEYLGINRARLARLEVDAGRQPLELVAQILVRSGFELTVRPVADGSDPGDPDRVVSSDKFESGDVCRPPSPPSTLDLFDAAGRRFPAHCDPYRLSSPHLWWYVRNGGWLTRAAPPTWSYECPARSTPRPGSRRPQDQSRTSEMTEASAASAFTAMTLATVQRPQT
jgi:transcriptional regulator with XRE-family HTH domain